VSIEKLVCVNREWLTDLLGQLAVVAARNNLWAGAEQRATLAAALFECCSSLSCCYLSPQAVRDSLLPGLRTLARDLDPERAQVAASIAKHLETKLSFGEPGPAARFAALSVARKPACESV